MTTDIIKIPAGTQVYLTAERDVVDDAFDVTEFTWPYLNAAPFPEPWAYYKFEEPNESELWVDATGKNNHLRRNLAYEPLPTSTTGKINNGP
jgi:hypothetical protein